MKKVLAWDDEKKTIVLEEPEELGKQFTLDYYGENISWDTGLFDSTFTPEAKLQVFTDVIDDRLNTLRKTIDELELIRRKILLIQRDLSFKEAKDGLVQLKGGETPPF